MVKTRKRLSLGEELAAHEDDGVMSVRMDRELYQAIEAYEKRVDSDSTSAAIRELISIGLTEVDMMEDGKLKTIKENARRSAIRRMTACFQAAITTFKDQDLEFEEDIGEE